MSLIAAFMTHEYLLACADQRKSGDKFSESFMKLFKFRDDLVIGLAGSVGDNFSLFNDYLEPKIENDETVLIAKDDITDDFDTACDRIKERIIKITANREDGSERSVHSFICGRSADSFAICLINMKNGEASLEVQRPSNDPKKLTFAICGADKKLIHEARLKELLNGRPLITIDILKIAFQETLNSGCKVDDSINNKPLFIQLTNRIKH